MSHSVSVELKKVKLEHICVSPV